MEISYFSESNEERKVPIGMSGWADSSTSAAIQSVRKNVLRWFFAFFF